MEQGGGNDRVDGPPRLGLQGVRMLVGRSIVLVVAILMLLHPASADESIPDSLVFGGDANYPPFEWADGGTIDGFNIELARLMLKGTGREARFQLGAWPEILDGLERGEIDVVPMFVSEERKQRYLFSGIFFYQTHAIFGRAEMPPIEGPGRFEGLRLAVERRSYAHTELETGDVSPVTLTLHDDTLEALEAVVEGRSDYALLAATTANDLIRRHSLPLQRKSAPFWPRAYAFAVMRDRPELSAWLDEQFALVMARGDYLELYEHWSPRLEVGDDFGAGYVRLIQFVLLGLLVLALLILAWNFSLRRRVAQRTMSIQSELRRRYDAEQRVRELHRLDPQTGHYNERHFHSRVQEWLLDNAGAAVGLVVVRLIDLERVSRTFGHSTASSLTRGFGEVLGRVASLHCAHLGRGVFAALIAGTDCRKFIDELAREAGAGNQPVRMRFSAGSAAYPADDATAGGLLQKAETALAAAIEQRAGWLPFDTSQQSDDADLQLVEDFRSTDGAGIRFLCQPQVRQSDRSSIACELLARWDHPVHGEVAPGRFVPLLEEAGLVGSLTARALAQAMQLSVDLRGEGLPARVSVNVSARDLSRSGFHEQVAGLLESHGARPSDLKFEITETCLMSRAGLARAQLEVLAGLGIQVSLDDFGTGYASLAYLAEYPISELKIDRTFVARIGDTGRGRSIVRALICMAREMQLEVVAEGVETEQMIEELGELGCDRLQGYAIARPMPIADYRRWLTETATRLVNPGRRSPSPQR